MAPRKPALPRCHPLRSVPPTSIGATHLDRCHPPFAVSAPGIDSLRWLSRSHGSRDCRIPSFALFVFLVVNLIRLPVSEWRTTRITGRSPATYSSEDAGHRRSRACEASRLVVLTETQRDCLRRVASLTRTNSTTLMVLRGHHEGHEEHEGIREHSAPVAGTGLRHLSASLWLREKTCLRVNDRDRRVQRSTSHRQCPAYDGLLLLVLTETRRRRDNHNLL